MSVRSMAIRESNAPHPSQKMNFLGRKRYSGDANARDVIDFQFDDCWWAISWLWFLFVVLTVVTFRKQLKLGLDKIINLFNSHSDIDIV